MPWWPRPSGARRSSGPDPFSEEEDERRRTTALAAEAKVKAAEAQLADARNRLAHTTVLAPTDGIVLTRTAEVGQIAVPGTTVLFRLARDGRDRNARTGRRAGSAAPESRAAGAKCSSTACATAFAGKVWQIGAIIDPTTRQGTVRIALPAADQDLRPGAFARAEIQVGSDHGRDPAADRGAER